MVSIFLFVFPLLLLQSSYAAAKFSDLQGQDLKGDTVSFDKYEGKCVLFLQLSPAARRPQTQVDELNEIYDKYHGKGLEVVAISTRRLDRITQRFEKMGPNFDIYTALHNREYIRFLRTKRMRLNAFDKILIEKDGETMDRVFIAPYLGHRRSEKGIVTLEDDIEECLGNGANETSPTSDMVETTDSTSEKSTDDGVRTDRGSSLIPSSPGYEYGSTESTSYWRDSTSRSPFDGSSTPDYWRESSTPDYWRDGSSTPDYWRGESSTPDWRRESSTPDYWREGSSTPDYWRGESSTPDYWRDGSSSPDYWRGESSTPDYWRDGSSTPDYWRDGSSSPDYWRGESSTPDYWRDGSSTPDYWRRESSTPDYWREGSSTPDWRRESSTPDYWREGSSTPDYWRDGSSTPDYWRDGSSTPDWRRESSTPDYWREGSSTPDWRRESSTPDYWREGSSTPDYWREGSSTPDWRRESSTPDSPLATDISSIDLKKNQPKHESNVGPIDSVWIFIKNLF